MKIKTINGIEYNKEQIRHMFSSQLELVKKTIKPEYKNILDVWLKKAESLN